MRVLRHSLVTCGIRAAPLVCLVVALSSCGGSSGSGGTSAPPDPPPPPPPAPVVSGLDARPANSTCHAGDAPASAVSLDLERAFAGVGSFSLPVLMLQEPSSDARWYVVQKMGLVHVFDNQPDVATRRVFVDVSAQISASPGDERGLLGMAFHPGWPADPRVYLSYTATTGGQLVSRVVEFTSDDGGVSLAGGSASVILQVDQPASNHNGGHIAFGPDGLLYIGLGDGGSGGDPWGDIGNGQRLSTLLGKMLRIDVDATSGATPYAIPGTNPFHGNAACHLDRGSFSHPCPEIFAYGLRNPWRWSFDAVSGELWAGYVGQGAWEEVNRIVAGGNFGWRCREGAHFFGDDCGPNAGPIDPVAEYGRTAGNSITGGYVYRGSAVPQLAGRYVFGDFGSGRIWHIARDTSPTLQVSAGFDSGLSISSFAQGADGEIHVVHYGGTLHRLVSAAADHAGPPAQLSATGCVDAADPSQPASGLVPYAPNAPFWSDGAAKERYLAVPDGRNITVAGDGDFDLPRGSVLMKHFRLGARMIETRLFMRHNDGNWAGYTYEWNQAGSDATRVVGGKVADIAGQTWLFPSEAQCLACHTAAAGRSLGLEVAQLNGTLAYPATGRNANQLATLDAVDLLTPSLTEPPSQLPMLADPQGSAGTLAQRARAWLHTNCSHCHRPGGPTGVGLDLRYSTPLAQTQACDAVPVRDLDVPGARLIAVGGGDPAGRSLLVLRAARADAEGMPPIRPRLVDEAGVALLTAWVESLQNCT